MVHINHSYHLALQSKHPIVKPVEQLVEQPAASCEQTFSRLSNQLLNRFDKRLNVCSHDAAGCLTGCETGDDLTQDVLTMEGRFDWGYYDFEMFRQRDV